MHSLYPYGAGEIDREIVTTRSGCLANKRNRIETAFGGKLAGTIELHLTRTKWVSSVGDWTLYYPRKYIGSLLGQWEYGNKNMDKQDIKNRNALLSIANEIKKFHLERNVRDKKHLNPIFGEFRLNKTSVKAKTKLLATLKKKLHIACVFAKMLLTIHAKKGINTYELHQVTTVKVKHPTNPECNSRKINHNFTYSTLINMAYNQLCSNKDESRVPEIDKLKEIICHLNTTATMLTQEKSKSENLERKNRFLATKLMLTENHLQNVMNQNDLFKKENLKLVKLINCQNDSALYPSPKLNSVLLNAQHNIKLYLSNMQSLVYDQTNMLKELGSLSKENIK
ncbi:unnamed protein product [Pieris brassicae]|uniref:Uncharacterized protein n=1 Tax=Pieris brassicae TaxID=7116 RepID=A0A9P0XCT7_PIEBR|nr:unnamed protein product [Pieris brassicae]